MSRDRGRTLSDADKEALKESIFSTATSPTGIRNSPFMKFMTNDIASPLRWCDREKLDKLEPLFSFEGDHPGATDGAWILLLKNEIKLAIDLDQIRDSTDASASFQLEFAEFIRILPKEVKSGMKELDQLNFKARKEISLLNDTQETKKLQKEMLINALRQVAMTCSKSENTEIKGYGSWLDAKINAATAPTKIYAQEFDHLLGYGVYFGSR